MKTTLKLTDQKGMVQAFEDNQQVGELTFLLKERVIVIDHTHTFKGYEGKGVAEALTLSAVEYAKGNRRKVVPECSYAYTYLMRHHELAGVLDEQVFE